MKKTITFLFLIISFSVFAQMDTIYTNSEKIPCNIKEITPEAVKFTYRDEDLVNSVYKSTIQKIVMKTGRVQNFAEATSYKMVKGVDDVDNVTLTSVESEVRGLFKLGDVSSKARGTTKFSSMEKVKERADRKMKTVAAMMGANLVYLTQNVTTPESRLQKTSTNLAGVAYSNKLPSYDDFKKLIGDKKLFQTYEKVELSGSDADYGKSSFLKNVQLTKVYNESGLTMVNANIDGVKTDTFRVINFNNEEFTLVWKDGDTIYNFRIKI